jgi:organic hydroperoxide reductase OsmC/OhrA
MTTHHYRAECTWQGSTAAGYRDYLRDHLGSSLPSVTTLELSADPAFRGDPTRLNPEQLLVLAAASCQLLSFLALAARTGLDVRAYRDVAEAEMTMEHEPIRIERIVLHPTITVAGGTDEAQVRELVALAHEQCYVANSLRTEIEIDTTIIATG